MKTKTKKTTKKMTKKKTRCILLLDRSGSMGRCAGMAVEGYNEHVDEFQSQANQEELDIDVCLVTFNGQVYEHFWGVKPETLQKSSLESFHPTGCTSLYDGIGYVIDKCNQEDDGETAYWLVIITDGDENSSTHYGNQYDPSIIKELLEGCDNTKRWTISFLGASKDQILHSVKDWGGNVALGNCAAWSNTAAGAKRMTARNRTAAKEYFAARSAGVDHVDNLYSDVPVVSDLTDYAADVNQQDQALGIDAQVAVLNSTQPAGFGFVRGVSWNSANNNPSYIPENVGTADVFGTSGKCVVTSDYKRSQNNPSVNGD